MLREFCTREHENDVLCVNQNGIKIYINAEDIRNQRIDEGCYELMQDNVFLNMYSNPHNDGVIPLLNPEGKPLALAKYCATSYVHDYDCDLERIDTTVFDLYECIVLWFDVPCAYLISKGYFPVINIVSSNNSIYSDSQGDDIWSKFFRQPVPIGQKDLENMDDITISPWACVTFSGKWLM